MKEQLDLVCTLLVNVQIIPYICCSEGQKSVVEAAQELLDCAKESPYMYTTPTVCFDFTRGVGKDVAKELESLGVVVKGPLLNDEELLNEDDGKELDYMLSR